MKKRSAAMPLAALWQLLRFAVPVLLVLLTFWLLLPVLGGWAIFLLAVMLLLWHTSLEAVYLLRSRRQAVKELGSQWTEMDRKSRRRFLREHTALAVQTRRAQLQQRRAKMEELRQRNKPRSCW